MPSFCRHNRFVQNCPICREPEPPRPRAKSTASRPRSSGASTTARRSAGSSASAMRVRRLTRAADDGYSSSLVPGLRATADAERLAEEIGFAAGRLAELAAAPPGLYADAASAPGGDEGIWLAAQIVLLGPADEADDPFAALRDVVAPWSSAVTTLDLDAFGFGPRSPFRDAAQAHRGLASLRAWAERQGGPAAALAGDAAWTPERRFERVYERLGTVSGMGRSRYDLLNVAGRLGLTDVDAPALLVGGNADTTTAAKRVFGIGDSLLIDRRALELATEAAVPVAALDLALANLDRLAGTPRMTIGASASAADPDAWARAAAALGVA